VEGRVAPIQAMLVGDRFQSRDCLFQNGRHGFLKRRVTKIDPASQRACFPSLALSIDLVWATAVVEFLVLWKGERGAVKKDAGLKVAQKKAMAEFAEPAAPTGYPANR